MQVRNNDNVKKIFFYRVNGQPKRVSIPGGQTVNLPDLIYDYQIIRNHYDLKVKKINFIFYRDIVTDFTVISDDGEETTYLFKTLDLGLTVPVDLVNRDGATIIEYNNQLHLFGGWNPFLFTGTSDSTNEHWITTNPDNPTSWTQLPDAPWIGAHAFQALVIGEYIYKFGNDGQNPGGNAYRYSDALGWELIAANMGSVWNNRTVTQSCYNSDDGYIYAIGGSDSGITVYYNDVIRATTALTDWTVVGSMPEGQYFGGTLQYVGNGEMRMWGGGQYLSSTVLNENVYSITSGGTTITTIASLPVAMRGTYINAAQFDGKLWHLNGYKGGNRYGLYYSDNFGISWTQLYDNPVPTHASAFAPFRDKLYRFTGNFDNYLYSIEKIIIPQNSIPAGATAIYSVRNNTNFIGNYAMQVQRSIDNTTMDIGFVGDDIDEESMITFMGAGDLFVSIHYDRSGNGNHISNVIGSRPIIGKAGTLLKIENKVAIYHTGGTQYLEASVDINIGKVNTIFGVVQFNAFDREFVGGDANMYLIYQNATISNTYSNNISSSGEIIPWGLSAQTLLTNYRDNRIIQRYKNGRINVTSWKTHSGNTDFVFRSPSGEANTSFRLIGYYQELIIYSSNMIQYKEGIEKNISDYYNAALSIS